MCNGYKLPVYMNGCIGEKKKNRTYLSICWRLLDVYVAHFERTNIVCRETNKSDGDKNMNLFLFKVKH